jgi:PAS domain S-box-containing protein
VVLADLRRVLSSLADVRLVAAGSAEEALAALDAGRWALAIIDVELPGKDGFALAEGLRAHEATTLVPIISSPAGTRARPGGSPATSTALWISWPSPWTRSSCAARSGPFSSCSATRSAGGHGPEYALIIERLQRSEKALEQSEQQFRAIFEFSTSGVAVFAPVDGGEDFIIEDVNPAAEALNKVPAEEAKGRRLTELFPDLVRSGLVQAMQRVARTGRSEVVYHSLAGGKRLEGERESLLYRLPSGEVVSVFRDVTEQAAYERRLKSSEEQFRVLAESMSEFVSLRDRTAAISTPAPPAVASSATSRPSSSTWTPTCSCIRATPSGSRARCTPRCCGGSGA